MGVSEKQAYFTGHLASYMLMKYKEEVIFSSLYRLLRKQKKNIYILNVPLPKYKKTNTITFSKY